MKRNILIIDDDIDLSLILSDMLESYGYRVACAKSSEQAFSMLETNTYHLIRLFFAVIMIGITVIFSNSDHLTDWQDRNGDQIIMANEIKQIIIDCEKLVENQKINYNKLL